MQGPRHDQPHVSIRLGEWPPGFGQNRIGNRLPGRLPDGKQSEHRAQTGGRQSANHKDRDGESARQVFAPALRIAGFWRKRTRGRLLPPSRVALYELWNVRALRNDNLNRFLGQFQ